MFFQNRNWSYWTNQQVSFILINKKDIQIFYPNAPVIWWSTYCDINLEYKCSQFLYLLFFSWFGSSSQGKVRMILFFDQKNQTTFTVVIRSLIFWDYLFILYRIWNFLVETTRTSKLAVIITTHYIDEARQANTVCNIKYVYRLRLLMI